MLSCYNQETIECGGSILNGLKLRFSSLAFKTFVLCFLFVFCCSTLLTQLAYVIIHKEISNNNQIYIQEILSKVDEYLELSFTSLQTILFSVQSAYDSGIKETDLLLPQMSRLYELNVNYIQNLYIIRQDLSISGVSVLSRVFNEALPERKALVDLAHDSYYSIVVSAPYQSTYSGWTITAVKALASDRQSIVAAVDMDMQRIKQRLLQLNRDNLLNILILDTEGHLVSGDPGQLSGYNPTTRKFQIQGLSSSDIASSHDRVINVEAASGESVVISKYPSERFGWSIISINDDRALKQSLARINKYYTWLLGITVLISVLGAFVVTRVIRKPLHRLMQKMNLVRSGNLDVSVSMERNDEFGVVSRTFDAMLQRIRELMSDLHKNEELKRKVEIQMLHSQINPHFLYNTLGSISNAVRLGKLDHVDPVIQSLTRIFEYGIGDVNHKVTLQEELQNVKDYLRIQNVRYNHEFTLDVEMPDNLSTTPVIRMMLQPIVENSVFHGYQGGRIPGIIRIKAEEADDCLMITVQDEGEGMDESRLRNILDSEFSPGHRRRRVGLKNIHQRLVLQYGSEYGLRVQSERGKGTRVLILLPSTVDSDTRGKDGEDGGMAMFDR